MLARSRIRPGLWLVFWREVGWLRRRPFLLGLATIVPLAQMAFLPAIFSAGLATRLPIGVLDLDSSDLSRTLIRMVDPTPDTAPPRPVPPLPQRPTLLPSPNTPRPLIP